jgi:hypothetical protein
MPNSIIFHVLIIPLFMTLFILNLSNNVKQKVFDCQDKQKHTQMQKQKHMQMKKKMRLQQCHV